MDSIFKLVLETLSRNNKVTYYRLDLFPANKELVLNRYNQSVKRALKSLPNEKTAESSRKQFSISESHFESVLWDKVKILWVRERGQSGYHEGIHYHYWLAVPHKGNIKPSGIGGLIQKVFTDKLKALPNISEEYTPEDNNEVQTEYASFEGFHTIYRTELNLVVQAEQKAELRKAIKNGTGHSKLNIEKIKGRISYAKIPIVGVFHEAIYAASYLAKVVSKDKLNPNDRSFSMDKFALPDSDPRRTEILKHQSFITSYFDEIAAIAQRNEESLIKNREAQTHGFSMRATPKEQ